MMGGKKIKIPLTCTTQAPDTSRETARLIIWLRSSEGRKKTYNFRQLSPISVRVMTVCGKRPCAASLPIHSNPYLAGEELLSVRVLLFNSFSNVPPPRLQQTGGAITALRIVLLYCRISAYFPPAYLCSQSKWGTVNGLEFKESSSGFNLPEPYTVI